MLLVTIFLGSAMMCFNGSCHNVLVGGQGSPTPVGVFQAKHVLTQDPGYHGKVLIFTVDGDKALAIHRVWNLKPSEHREERIASKNPEDRKMSHGCVNVKADVFDELWAANNVIVRIEE